MAKLSAHGKEIGRITYTTYAKAYMEDGVVLKNAGFGWKVAGKVKAGFTPQSAYETALASQRAFAETHPRLMAYRKELHEMAGLGKAWKLHMAVQVMPDDPDGVWSEACDGYGDNVHADIDEVSHLCDLYKSALDESRELKSATV